MCTGQPGSYPPNGGTHGRGPTRSASASWVAVQAHPFGPTDEARVIRRLLGSLPGGSQMLELKGVSANQRRPNFSILFNHVSFVWHLGASTPAPLGDPWHLGAVEWWATATLPPSAHGSGQPHGKRPTDQLPNQGVTGVTFELTIVCKGQSPSRGGHAIHGHLSVVQWSSREPPKTSKNKERGLAL